MLPLFSADPGEDREALTTRSIATLGPGVFHLPLALPAALQREIVEQCFELMDGPAPGYVPTVRGGGKMHVRMLCLGRHWNGQHYRYEARRSDFDNLPAPALPPRFVELARDIAARVGFALEADICIINHYDRDGRMGLHQDKDESRASLDAGMPVVSLSIGDTARFQLGGLSRRDPVQVLTLHSGDAFVFGGPGRLRYHGVARIFADTAPGWMPRPGRLNLTFRQY